MMLFLLAFVVGFCGGLATWATGRTFEMYQQTQS